MCIKMRPSICQSAFLPLSIYCSFKLSPATSGYLLSSYVK